MQVRLALFAGSVLGLFCLAHCGGGTKRPETPEAAPSASASAVDAGAEGGAGGEGPEEPHEKPRRPDPRLVQKALDRSGAEAPAAEGAHGVRFEVVEVGPDATWAFVVVNRGTEDAHVVFDPRLLTLEIDAPPDPSAKRKKPLKPRVCRLPPPLRPEGGDKDYVIQLAPGQGMVEAFDPRLYCLPGEGVSPLVAGAKVRATFGFPVKTKTVWKRGKREEEVLPQIAPFVATIFPASALASHEEHERDHEHEHEHERDHEHHHGHHHDRDREKEQHPPADGGSVTEEPRKAAEDHPPHIEEHHPPVEPAGTVKILTATPFELGSDYAPPEKLKEETLALELERGSDAFSESQVTVTTKLVNHGKAPERVYFRRELVSYQVTGPDGSLICDPQPDSRSPDRQAFSLLNPGASLIVTSRLIELCPDDTFARPGIYVVEAAFDAYADGKEFGYEAFVGHVVADRGVIVRVQTGELPFPGPRAVESVRVGAPPNP